MSTGKIFAYIGAALFIVFGALFILGSGDPARGGGFGWIFTGIILVAAGAVLIWLASRKPKTTAAENATYKVELSGNVKMETLKCKSCGGTLTSENVKMVAGAPVVTCPYCNTTYQLTEEPKW
jgi:hypothetical protein